MITAERLEELIKQGKRIYHVYRDAIEIMCGIDNLRIKPITDIMIDPIVKEDKLVYENLDDSRIVEIPLEDLFENRELAEKSCEWNSKMTAERTERFEPPMWKELLEKDLYAFTFVKDGEVYDFICNNYLEKVDIRLEQRLVGYSSKPVTACQFNDATKENYTKACEIVRDLFNKS